MFTSRSFACRIIGPLLAVLGLMLLSGCSAVKLAYNNAPEFAFWWIDRYVDLDDTQSRKVRADLAQMQRWHRQTELPKIADLLQRTRQDTPANVTGEQVCALFEEVRQRIDNVAKHAEPAYVALAMNLSQEQLANLAARYRKTNLEWRDEWANGGQEQRLKLRVKSAQERSEDFYGPLLPTQETLLRNSLARSDFDPELNYRERVRRQQDLLQTLRFTSNLGGGSGPAPTVAQATEALRGYLERSLQSPTPAYRAWSDKAVTEGCATIAELHNSTTTEQRSRAVKRLTAYERSARELAAER